MNSEFLFYFLRYKTSRMSIFLSTLFCYKIIRINIMLFSAPIKLMKNCKENKIKSQKQKVMENEGK